MAQRMIHLEVNTCIGSYCSCHRIWQRVSPPLLLLYRTSSNLICHSDDQDGGTSLPGLPVPEKYTRAYESVPQPELNNRTSTLYAGAVVGGGTVVNGMFFNRGSAGDYEAWEKLGNPGWGWEGLLPYFKKVRYAHMDAMHYVVTSLTSLIPERDVHAACRCDCRGVSRRHLE